MNRKPLKNAFLYYFQSQINGGGKLNKIPHSQSPAEKPREGAET